MGFLARFRKDRLFSDQYVADVMKQNEWLLSMRKGEYDRLTTAAPRAEVLDSGSEYDIRIPRFGTIWYLRELRLDSPILQSIVLKLNQEIFRETKKDGLEWEPRFKVKCPICKTEFDTEEETCTQCPNIPLITPDPAQQQLLKPFLLEANKAEQTLIQVLEEIEFDLEDYDNAYMVLIKEYFSGPAATKTLSRVVELMRGNPMLFRIVSDLSGRRGGRWWVCPIPAHRPRVSEEPGKCREPLCNLMMEEVTYVELIHDGSGIINRYIRGEVIHFSKYNPSRLYGVSPVLTVWILVRTLVLMDRFVEKLYEKGRLKGILGVTTKNPGALKTWWEETQARLRSDPHYLPLVGIESETGRGRFEFVSLMESLQDLNYNETKRFIREQITALFGVSNIFLADTSTGGGLNNEGLQIAVTDRAVEDGQSVWHTNAFPKLLLALGIKDWELKLRSSREIDEMADAQLEHQQAQTAQVYQSMGYQVIKTEEGFDIEGEAFTVEAPQQGFGSFFPQGPTEFDAVESNPALPAAPQEVDVMQAKSLAIKKKDHVLEKNADMVAHLLCIKNKCEKAGILPPEKFKTLGELRQWWDTAKAKDPTLKNMDVDCDKAGEIGAVEDPDYPNLYKAQGFKAFDMIRHGDETGTSGTGLVLSGVIFPDGVVTVRWSTKDNPNSTVVYDSFEDFKAIHIDAHPNNETELRFFDITPDEFFDPNLTFGQLKMLKARESSRKVTRQVDKVENQFTAAIVKLYNEKLLTKVGKFKDVGQKKMAGEVTQILQSLQPDLQMKAFNQVLRAYRRGKQITPIGEIGKTATHAPRDLSFNNLPFGKPDIQVLKTIYETSPFWTAFDSMTQTISDQLKEVITESFADPEVFTLGNLIKEMKQVINTQTYRLERIARSESTAITAKGREIAFSIDEKESGLEHGYNWMGPNDNRTTDIDKEIRRRVQAEGQGKGVSLTRIKDIMWDVTKSLNPGWKRRDWLPHGNCRGRLVRVS